MTDWPYRINVIIPVSRSAEMNALWSVIAPNGDPEALSFGVPLSQNGKNPASHTAISTAATEAMMLKITQTFVEDLADAGAIVSVQTHTENNFESLVAAQGLRTITGELP